MATGMIVDGVFASQAIDSSGEILDVDGCDISTLDVDGVANYEHKSPDDKDQDANNGEEIVGKIIFAKKIFKESDCDTDRERLYWNQVKVPYIYGMVRLYDGAGHSGAQALAAQIRDHHANDEPILVRYSIEGSTLERSPSNKNHLTVSVARRVAMTLKPCNRTCVSGLIEDPRAPDGFDKQPLGSAKAKDILADLMDKAEAKLSHPNYTKLGGACEVECNPLISDEIMEKLRLVAKAKMLKALTAGSYNVAPSALEGGAALQVEDRSLKARMKRAITEYKPEKEFDKAEFRAYAKSQLPEADDNFLDHFTDVAEDYHMKLKKAISLEGDRIVEPKEGLGWAAPPEPKKPPKAKKPKKGEVAKPMAALAPPPPEVKAPPVSNVPNPHAEIPGQGGAKKNSLTLHPNGNLQLPDGTMLELHIPSGKEYMEILHPDSHEMSEEKRALYKRTVHEPWERAMQSWMEINKCAREGKLPLSVIKLAGLFSAMSPNTGVPLQERHFGHLMDMMHEGVLDISKPITEQHIAEFKRRAQGPNMPMWNNDLYNTIIPPEELPDEVRAKNPNGKPRFPPPGVDDEEEAAKRAAKKNKFGNAKAELPQIAGLRHLDDIMAHLEDLFARHKGDARAMAGELMNMKADYKAKASAKNPATKKPFGAAAAKEHFEDKHPVVQGFGPKLARYLLTMAGGGNTIVPDRHMTRSLYNLGKDDPLAEYLAINVVTQARNEPFLASLDQHFFHKHPAVQYVLNKYPEHFKGHEEQAIFPAFWLHWLHIPHYERNQGRETEATIGGTDHRVFWDALQDIMRHHGIPVKGEHYHYTPPDTSFDFGENVAKAEPAHPMAHLPLHVRAMGAMQTLAMRFGENAAMIGYFTHIAPALMDAERGKRRRNPHAIIRKAQAMTIDLRKMAADLRQPVRQASTHYFAGNPVIAGKAQAYNTRFDLLHEDDQHYIAVPEGQKPAPNTLVKLPKAKEGTHYTVSQRPSVLVADLD